MVEEGWLSVDEVAQELGITVNNLRQIQHRKQLKWGKREGRKVFYHITEVQSFASKRKPRNG